MPQLIEEYLLDAVAVISAWDIPDEEFAEAVNAQARLMAGASSDDTRFVDSDASTQ